MFPIALNSFREFIRNKILTLITFFAVVLIGFSLFLASISMGEVSRLVRDFGIQMIEWFGVVTVVFLGSQMLFRELEGRTIYLILSKPIERYEFLIGKFL
jgi:ABC-type transport system involved in multi-copper enzyme maturation permease subunit